jgi:hypothetical protein
MIIKIVIRIGIYFSTGCTATYIFVRLKEMSLQITLTVVENNLTRFYNQL